MYMYIYTSIKNDPFIFFFTEIDYKSQFFKTDSTDIYNLSVEAFIYLKHGTKKIPIQEAWLLFYLTCWFIFTIIVLFWVIFHDQLINFLKEGCSRNYDMLLKVVMTCIYSANSDVTARHVISESIRSV